MYVCPPKVPGKKLPRRYYKLISRQSLVDEVGANDALNGEDEQEVIMSFILVPHISLVSHYTR